MDFRSGSKKEAGTFLLLRGIEGRCCCCLSATAADAFALEAAFRLQGSKEEGEAAVATPLGSLACSEHRSLSLDGVLFDFFAFFSCNDDKGACRRSKALMLYRYRGECRIQGGSMSFLSLSK